MRRYEMNMPINQSSLSQFLREEVNAGVRIIYYSEL